MGRKGYDNASQHPSGYSKCDRESSRICVYRRNNPAVITAKTTVSPDLAAETAPLPDRLPEALELVEVEVGMTVLVVVMLDGLVG